MFQLEEQGLKHLLLLGCDVMVRDSNVDNVEEVHFMVCSSE